MTMRAGKCLFRQSIVTTRQAHRPVARLLKGLNGREKLFVPFDVLSLFFSMSFPRLLAGPCRGSPSMPS
jgi:hypothetical protein